MSSMLIIDGNNWFRRRAETDPTGNPLRRCFYEIQSSPNDIVVLVWDGKGALKSRREIYPEYKAGRKFAGESLYEFQNTFKEIATLSRAVSVEVPLYEGDDVIAAIANKYKKEMTVKIESNDADLSQLGLPMTRETFKIEPRWIPLFKTLVGDSSDNIKGIAGFGQKAWDKLSEHQKKQLEIVMKGGILLPEYKEWFTTGQQKWITENISLLKSYWKIVNFIEVDWKLVESKMMSGSDRPDLAEEIFKQYMC